MSPLVRRDLDRAPRPASRAHREVGGIEVLLTFLVAAAVLTAFYLAVSILKVMNKWSVSPADGEASRANPCRDRVAIRARPDHLG
jgi:hypothetical protein